MKDEGGKLGAPSMRATGLFRYSFQRRFVGVGEGGGDWAVLSDVWADNRFDEIVSLRARVFDAPIRNETAHNVRGGFVAGAGEAFEFSR